MKQLVINEEHPNGIIVEVEDEVFEIPFKDRVISRIREFYSVDDEIAIIRQKDTKPEEFAEYNAFVEQIKEEERYGN
jgi:hypothetical protein